MITDKDVWEEINRYKTRDISTMNNGVKTEPASGR
jgi:hypothetical protein